MKWLSRLGFHRPAVSAEVRCLQRRRQTRNNRRHARLGQAAPLAQECLEPRIALAITIYTNVSWSQPGGGGLPAVAQPGFVTIVSDNADDVYLQQVATFPQDLIVADNSSFLGYQTVQNIDSYRTLYVTNGTQVSAGTVVSDNYPMSGLLQTSYALGVVPQAWLNNFNLSYALQISYAGSTWQFNDDPVPTMITGPILPIYPTGVRVDAGVANATLVVTWSAPPAISNLTGVPTVDAVRVNWADGIFTGGLGQLNNLLPSSMANPVFTLPMPNGPRVSITPGTLSGVVNVAGQNIAFRSAGPQRNELLFGATSPNYDFQAGSYRTARRMTGTIDYATGQISLSFVELNFTGQPAGAQEVGPVSLSGVTFSTSLVNPTPMQVTFFPGHDITREIVVDLLSPGSTLNVQSPIRNSTTTATGLAVLGTGVDTGKVVAIVVVGGGGVYTAAPIVTIDPPPTSVGTAPAGIPATAVATIDSSGAVTGVTIGSQGSGYTRPPRVSFSAPTSAKIIGADIVINTTNINVDAQMVANDRFDIGPEAINRFFGQNIVANRTTPQLLPALATAIVLTNPGQVDDIVVVPGFNGAGYDPSNPPLVTIGAPNGVAGRQATATAIVSSGGSILGFTITDNGAGYTSVPLVTIPPPYPVAATAIATLLAGTITGVTVTGGGFGYRSPPEVTIDPPPLGGTTATATATLGPGGVVTAITMTSFGSGYTSLPSVVLAFPDPFVRGNAVVSPDGTITAVTITSSGYGYSSAPLVTIAPPPSGSGGTRAQAHATLNASGVVTGIVIDYAGSGYDPLSPPLVLISTPLLNAVAERVAINAGVGSTIFDIRINDDLGTSIDRGQLFVSPTGSLSGNASPTSQVVGTPATDFFLQADISDVIVEGRIYASKQSYLLRSFAERNYLAPFLFTTRSPFSGADTGLIHGATVAVTMANDAPTPQSGSTAFNTIELSTQIDSFRIKAGTSKINPTGAFPYTLTINEVDDIQFDAVAASSNAITIVANGSITFNSAVATEGDLFITAARQDAGAGLGQKTTVFRVSAPLSTTLGRIGITADDIYVSSSLRVTAAAIDIAQDDIVLTATGGSIELGGGISAVNNIRLVQRNLSAASQGKISGKALVVAQKIEIESEGSVNIRTRAVTLAGRAVSGFEVAEADDIFISSLSSGGLVSLTAAGADPGPGNANSIGLRANLIDVVNLVVSAPSGTIEIFVDSSQTLVLGDAAGLRGGYAQAMSAAGSVKIRSFGSIDVLDAPLAGGSARIVRAVSTDVLTASYAVNSPGTTASTLTGTGSINNTLLFDGIRDLRVGERVLVQNGTKPNVSALVTQDSNGIYTVTRLGGGVGANANWVLTRSTDADTGPESPTNTFVRATEGTLFRNQVFGLTYAVVPPTVAFRASSTELELSPEFTAGYVAKLSVGQMVLGAGISPGTTIGAIDATTGVLTLTATPGPAITGLGLTQVTFLDRAFGQTPITLTPIILTTDIGSENNGSILTFVTSTSGTTNAAAGSLGKMIALINFNTPIAVAVPGQEQITDFKFATSISRPIRLTQQLPAIEKGFVMDGGRRYGVGAGVKIVIDGSRITQTRNATAVLQTSEINGLEIASTSQGMIVQALTIGGFSKGSALKLTGAKSVLLNRLQIGVDENGNRLANQFGIRIGGASDTVTVSNSVITSSTIAGVSVRGSGTRVRLVGNTIGAVNQENQTGVEFMSTGTNRLGTDPVLPATIIAPVAVVRVSNTTFTLPKSAVQVASLFVGLGVRGITITPAAGRAAAEISAISTNALTQITTVTISNGTIARNGSVTFANYVQTTADGTQIRSLPGAIKMANLFLGQSVSGTGIPTTATILAIDQMTRSITLSLPMTQSGITAVSFAAGGRNAVQQNRYGVVMSLGINTITNTSISSTTFDGITVTGGVQTIGTSKTLSAQSNAIFSNRGFGIVVKATASTRPTIRGNYLGSRAPATTELPNLNGNISISPVQLIWISNPLTNLDSEGNLHGLAKKASASGTGGTGGVGVPPPGIFPRR